MSIHPHRLFRAIALAALAIGLAVLIASPLVCGRPVSAAEAVGSFPANGGNLLINPDFENGYRW